MKRQTRPFMIETKSPRPRVPSPGSLTSGSAPQGFDPFPDDLPVRDVHEDLTHDGSSKSQALKEAERAFAGLTSYAPERSAVLTGLPLFAPVDGVGVQSRAQTAAYSALKLVTAQPEVRRPRVLPDLSQEAREKEPPSPAEPTRLARVKRSSSCPGQPRARRPRKEQAAEVAGSLSSAPVHQGLPSPASPPSLPPGLASAAVAPLAEAGAQKQPRWLWSRELPRGERWKTRRLPRVCWARPRWR
jgi:hypothetical protein